MELSLLQYLAVFGVGILTGAINTLAGSGSFITLPVLIFLGFSPAIANGTNRVGVLVQSAVGAYSLKKFGGLDLDNSIWFILPAIIGAILGAQLAVVINEKALYNFIGVLMVIMLVIILLDPKKWLREHSEESNRHRSLWMILLFFLIGVYGGFIQAGVGIFILTSLVLLGKYNFNHSNAIKLVVALCFTVPAIAIFIYNDQIAWGAGITLAVGQSIGAVAAAAFATKIPNANAWMHKLLVLIMVIVIIRYFNLYYVIYNLFVG